MKKYAGALCLMACLAVPGMLWAQQAQQFAVAPFQVHGPDKYQYLQKGIQSMLTSRLTWEGRLMPKREGGMQPVGSTGQAEEMMQELGVDHLVWGETTIVGQEANVSVHLAGAQGEKDFSRTAALDKLIPALEDVAGDIRDTIFPQEKESAGQETGEAGSAGQSAENATPKVNENFVYQKQPAEGEQLNPQFEYTGYQGSKGRWRSQSLSVTATNMIVGDGDGDGDNEVFLLTDNGVRAYTIEGNKLSQLAVYEAPRRLECLNLNSVDLNRDGYLEIVVSAMQGERVESFVLNFKDGKFEVVEKDINFFMNVVRQPPGYRPVLIGQRKGKSKLFDPPVQEVLRMDGKLTLQRKVDLPSRTNVFNFTYLPFKDRHKIVMVTENDRLAVFNHKNNIEYITSKTYAASAQGIPKDTSFPGLGQDTEDPTRFYYIPSRLVPCNLDQNDEFEVLANRNISMAAQFFSRYRYFPKGEIHSLFWDGVGLSPQWTTRPINGTVVDYGIADMNNDGGTELYVCIATHPGLTGFSERKTVVYAYELNVQGGDVATEGFYLQPGQKEQN